MFMDVAGTLLIAYAALAVHHRFRHEHKVDDAVFSEMNREEKLAIAGVALILLGFIVVVGARLAS